MDSEQLSKRTKVFALEIIHFFQSLPAREESRVLGKQLLRSATSVAANYRAARRARSDSEFYSKICIVVEESDETLFWLDLIKEAGLTQDNNIELLMKEAEELLQIFSSTRKSLKNRIFDKR